MCIPETNTKQCCLQTLIEKKFRNLSLMTPILIRYITSSIHLQQLLSFVSPQKSLEHHLNHANSLKNNLTTLALIIF